ncbi:MAG: hypothetical protein AAB425_10055, partial [Bdellovibrionota bacterium]
TPEQKVVRFFLSEPTSAFPSRVIASRLKGVRGLGGADGIAKILTRLQALGLVDIVDNGRGARLRDDAGPVRVLKTIAAVCELGDLSRTLAPICSRLILYGSHADGLATTTSRYEIMVVTSQGNDVRRIVEGHPQSKRIEVVTRTNDEYLEMDRKETSFFARISRGVSLWP